LRTLTVGVHTGSFNTKNITFFGHAVYLCVSAHSQK